MRHRILYAEYEWKQQRLLPLVLLAGGVVFGFQGLQHPSAASLIWVAYIPIAFLFGAFYYLRRRRHYIEAAEDGLHVGRTFTKLTIPYEVIRTARVLPLRQLASEPVNGKKRYLPPPVKASLDKPSVVLRLQGEPQDLQALTKRLGPRHMFDGSAAFPVTDAEGAVRDIAKHLPLGTGSNLGGSRRRGRKRR